MAQSVYLNEWEQKKLYKKMIELNNKLAEKNMRGISKESQLVHKIIELAIEQLEVSENGSIILKLVPSLTLLETVIDPLCCWIVA